MRGSLGFAGFGSLNVAQNGGVEYVKHGGGVGLWFGLDIGRFFGIRLGYDASFHNPVTTCGAGKNYVWCDQNYLLMETVQFDVTIHFPTGTRFQPYLMGGLLVGLIGRLGAPSDSVGGGFEAGGGFDVWVSRHFTVGVEAKYRGLRMGDYANYTGTNTYLSFVNVGANMAIRF